MPGTLVVAETRDGQVNQATFELIGAGSRLSEAGAGPLRVLVVSSEPERYTVLLGVPGVAEVLTVSSPVEQFESHVESAAVKAVIQAEQPEVVLACHSADGMQFAPAVAAELGLGFVPGATGVAWEEGSPVVTRASMRLAFPRKPTVLVMLRSGVLDPVAPGNGDAPVRDAGVTLHASAAATRHLGNRRRTEPGASPVVMAIGRGVADAAGVEELEAIAGKVGATLLVSGGLVDAGLGSRERKVGQTGQIVEPRVYLALGISGAPQHLMGVRSGATIIAVNIDPDAPIFRRASYGAVADLFEVARALADQFIS